MAAAHARRPGPVQAFRPQCSSEGSCLQSTVTQHSLSWRTDMSAELFPNLALESFYFGIVDHLGYFQPIMCAEEQLFSPAQD